MGVLKGQGSMEYLNNYTIAIVIVIIVLAAFTYLGVWDMILGGSQAPICIFQKGLGCKSYYIQRGNGVVQMTLFNDFELDAIVVSGVICSAEPINPATALPQGKNFAPHGKPPFANFTSEPISTKSYFDVNVTCYTEKSQDISVLSPQDRYNGRVFIQYRFNSSSNLFVHTIQGNLQGKPN